MTSKTFNGLVVAFWVVMMIALVRVEFFPRESHLVPLSMTRVLDRVFQNPEPARLDVLYQGAKIGFLRMDGAPYAPLGGEGASAVPTATGKQDVTVDLWLNLIVFGTPSRLHLHGRFLVDAQYEIQNFNLHTTLGESHATIKGDNATKKLSLLFDIGDGQQEREVDYADLSRPDALNALGLTGLPGLPSLAGFGLLNGSTPGSAGKGDGLANVRLRAYYDTVKIGGLDQRAYLIDVKLHENLDLWAKLWVDEQGNIILVNTSAGLTLRSQTIGAIENSEVVDLTFQQLPRRR